MITCNLNYVYKVQFNGISKNFKYFNTLKLTMSLYWLCHVDIISSIKVNVSKCKK